MLSLGLLILFLQVVLSPPGNWACLNQLYADDDSGGNSVISTDMSGSKTRSSGGGLISSNSDDGGLIYRGRSRRICYPDGICFSNDQSPYTGLPLPVPPVGMPLRYYLYTPESSAIEDLPVTGDTVSFMDDRPLKVFVHGFGMNAANILVLEFARKMVYQCECNVIIVDWRGGSYGGYTSTVSHENFRGRALRAFSNTRVAARMLGKFLHRLYEKRNTLLPKVGLHCIGVDLGAHICALLQESFHEPLARISGLNPTVPSGCGLGCLDQTDASFVDAIHTTKGGVVGRERGRVVDLGELGSDETVGHMDFFVNWDQKMQPMCGLKDSDVPQRCGSRRALELFTLSLGETCYFISRSCDQSPSQNSKCTACVSPIHQCARLGYGANKSVLFDTNINRNGGKFFLDTSDQSPYCGKDD